jgi:hypothetical protein
MPANRNKRKPSFGTGFRGSSFRIGLTERPDTLGKLLPRHPQFDHHPLLAFVINHEMTME